MKVTPVKVTLTRSGARQRKIIENLVHFYVYDIACVMGWPSPADGMYRGCDDVPGYFGDERSSAYLIRVGREWAGFVLVDGHPKRRGCDWRIGQFFVVGKFKRRGVGTAAARETFHRFPGRWHVEYLKRNTPAVGFWRRVIQDYTRGRVGERSIRSPWGAMWLAEFTSSAPPATRSKRRRTAAR